MPIEEAPQPAIADRDAALVERRPELLECDVPLRLVERKDRLAMRFDRVRALVAAHPPWACVSLLAFQHPPTADARGTDAEPLTCLPMAQPRRDRSQNTDPKIE